MFHIGDKPKEGKQLPIGTKILLLKQCPHKPTNIVVWNPIAIENFCQKKIRKEITKLIIDTTVN